MPNDLAAYRTHLDNLLATAVDSSTWTTAIKDQALRMALQAYDLYPTYETSFTVTSAGHAQDLSGISAMKQVLGIAYPWDGHSRLEDLAVPWRTTGFNTIWIDGVEPQVDEIIRVRYQKTHVIKDLDSAAATTVPDTDQHALALLAAGWCCFLRARQLSENPAPPRDAIETLGDLSNTFMTQAHEMLRPFALSLIAWPDLGLDV